MKFVEWMDELLFVVKVIFCLLFFDIIWVIYRIVKGVELKNNGLLIVGILWIVFGWNILWIIDIVIIIVMGKLILIDVL